MQSMVAEMSQQQECAMAWWQPEPEATSDFTSTARKQELDQKYEQAKKL